MPGAPDLVLDHIEDGADIIVPLANGEPVARARRHRGATPTGSPACASTRCTRCTTGRTSTARSRDHLLHVSYFLSPRDPPGVPRARLRARAEPLQRGAATAAARRPSARWCSPPPPPMDRHGYFSLGTNCDYVGAVHRARAVLPRGQRADAAHVRAQPDPRQPGRRVDRGGPPAGRDRTRRARPTSTGRIAALRRRAHPRRRHDPGRHRRHPERAAGGARRPPRPRHPHRAALRRRRWTWSSAASSPGPTSVLHPARS